MKSKLCILFIVLIGAAILPARAAAQPAKLNVLLIAVDDLRDTLGCYGNAAVKTPHIDRLAARAVRFDRAYVQYTVCNPSRSSFLTGLRPNQSGVTDNRTLLRERQPNIVTLPQLLKEDGRHSAAFGKIFHLGGGRDAALRDPALPGKSAAFTLVVRGPKQRGDSIRTDRWRYTEWSDGTRELYDHTTDPEETRNVAATNPNVARDLGQQLRTARR